MPYFESDTAKDAKLNYYKNNATKLVLTEGEPTSFANANTNNGSGSGQKCVEVTVDSDDFTLADGDTDGRKVTCAAKSGLTPPADGSADHWAWLDISNSAILAYAPLGSTLAVTTSGSVSIPATTVIDRDLTAVA